MQECFVRLWLHWETLKVNEWSFKQAEKKLIDSNVKQWKEMTEKNDNSNISVKWAYFLCW